MAQTWSVCGARCCPCRSSGCGRCLEAWRASLELIEAWRPRSLAPTHFGVYEDVDQHLTALREQLERMQALAAKGDQAAFASAIRAQVAASSTPETTAAYEQAMPPGQSFQGLVR